MYYQTAGHFIGVKKVEASPETRDGKPGYAVCYPDGYRSWSPKEAFETAYLPMSSTVWKDPETGTSCESLNANRVTAEMVEAFIVSEEVQTTGTKTTVVRATLANGFEIVESSSCVDPANYSEQVGAEICRDRIRDRVWHLLGFVLQWARSGLAFGDRQPAA